MTSYIGNICLAPEFEVRFRRIAVWFYYTPSRLFILTIRTVGFPPRTAPGHSLAIQVLAIPLANLPDPPSPYCQNERSSSFVIQFSMSFSEAFEGLEPAQDVQNLYRMCIGTLFRIG